MLGATTVWDKLGGRVPGEKSNLEMLLRVLAKGGVPLLLLDEDHAVIDVRSKAAIKKDTQAVRDAAAALGIDGADELPGPEGVEIATAEPAVIGRYFAAYQKAHGFDAVPEVGMALTGEKLVIAHAPNDDATADFIESYRKTTGTHILPTVDLPDGGAHFYLTLDPSIVLPEHLTCVTVSGWTLLMRDQYVPIPPSSLRGTPLVWNGDVRPLPKQILDWLLVLPVPQLDR